MEEKRKREVEKEIEKERRRKEGRKEGIEGSEKEKERARETFSRAEAKPRSRVRWVLEGTQRRVGGRRRTEIGVGR